MSEKQRGGGILSESESKEMQDLVMPFLEVQKAYEVLSNEKKRKEYDKSGCEEKNTAKSDDLFADYIRKQPYHFLYQSILAGDLESVRTVVEKFSVDINIKYDCIYIGITPINYAIKEDHEQIVDYLISKGAKVSLIDALRLAIKLNSYKTAGLLLGKLDVDDINVQDSDGNTIFHDFFKYFNNPNSDDFVLKKTLFNFDAFNFGQPSSKKSSSENSSNPNVQKDTQDNNISCNTSPLYKNIIKLFDQCQSKMNSMEFREGCARESVIISLKNAVSFFHSLIDKGVRYDISNSEHVTSLDVCIDQFVDNHRKSLWTDYIFYYDRVETEKAYYSMMNVFVEKGIIGLKDANGIPISHKIVEHNIYPHVENKANIDLMEEDSSGKNALVKGCCDVSTIESLIENGVDLNTPDSLGQTLLHYVVSEYCNSVEEVGQSFQLEEVNKRFYPKLEALIKGGAKIDAKDNNDKSPIDLLVERGKNMKEDINCSAEEKSAALKNSLEVLGIKQEEEKTPEQEQPEVLDQVNQDDDVLPSNLEEEKTPGNKQEQLSQPEIPVSDQANNTQGDGVQLSNPEKEKTPEQEQPEVLDQVNQDDDVLPSNLEEEKTPGNKQEQLSQPEIPVSDQANNTQGDGVQLSNPEKEKTPEQEQPEVLDQVNQDDDVLPSNLEEEKTPEQEQLEVSDQKIGIQNNNQQPSKPNAAAPRSEKRTIIAASVLAIAGVALGITIAVYLEMLAVGVAVGVCCLIAAAIIYCCNQPSKSLENSKVQGFSGNHEQPTL
ncbi:hypothetical protein NMD99_03290 [Wolbachia endosymbiont of Listronotus oregonensis]|uniref:TomO hydrophobic C-terminal domain-containing protein n=1 Tax=Wolbachia endosymbiont of Listronotus oregonensis TaxID=2969106 RepID=UPI002814BE18|nr:hypothetical protein [Wolbachia endosymbiont of Listronotus oregonensis]WMT85008.1 hypothetical protein NMD99_03290 [Wolbachia endosymbiont of Listronotus oregonensis]